MILDTIRLNNFGIFGGSQEVALAPLDSKRPIILFGGMNGGGKTTFLDAIQLALFGPKARCSGRGKLAYRDYLREMIHRGADPTGGASIEVRFRRAVDGEMHYYRIARSWREKNESIDESVKVTCDAELDDSLSQHWDEYIESYIPSGIAHLFFFDAEQIKDLAEANRSAEILGTAIHTLLGLDLVDRLDTDLIALARRKRASAQTTEETEKARIAEEELNRIQKLLDAAKQEQGALGNEVGRIAKELASCEEKFRQEGGDLYLLRADIEMERENLTKAISVEESSLRKLTEGAAPLLLVPPLIEDIEKQARRESKMRKSAVLAAVLEERDADMLAILRQKKISAQHISLIEQLFQSDREERRNPISAPIIIDGGDHLATEVRHLREKVLPELKSTIAQKLESINTLLERLTRCDLQLGKVPSEDAIAKLQKDLGYLRKKLKEKQAELNLQEDKVRVLARQHEDANRKIERELGLEIDSQINREHTSRVLRHSVRVRETLAKFRVAVIRKHAERLERLVLESFTHLLRKRALVTGLKIDPATFRLELTGGDSKPLPFERLSAGERQLLATSLLWGLAKASGRPLPTVIDTPLGRLDSSHRLHLLDRYFPVASHQVILLSTDQEVNETSLARLKPHIGRTYTLAFDETKHSTVIKPGYFWNHESAT